MNTEQEITKLAAEIAKQINENKSEDGYTIICTHRELRHMVQKAISDNEDTHSEGMALCSFFDEMRDEHNLFLTVSQFDDVVLDEREEEF